MIEKKIHYIWMGRGPKSELIQKCMESWKVHLSEYEIVEWNEDNFDIHSNKFVLEAYNNKKWAYVSDYVRLFAIYNHGGIYMDTDMEIMKPLDKFLNHRAFSGFESVRHIPTGIMGAEKGHPWIKDLLNHYSNNSFLKEDGSLDLTPNVVSITDITKEKYKIIMNNQYQVLPEDLHIYPKEFFCPSDYGDTPKQITKKITSSSYSIHHYDGSWLSTWGKAKTKIKRLLGTTNSEKILNIINKRN
ncbi:glycosyltransferase family 32 protein [Planomicrobium okeanokoites]|uniref:glycosyltransferase family 32 protein n=1 Tax=Planomicrobium okeanokoites TaxID=244 RepID=UPI0024909EEF|nr:glycosyltransferase [Planomicrobium okeanokoites]